MTNTPLPLVIEAEQLQPLLGTPGLLIIDLCKPGTYARAHVPGAIHMDYARVVMVQKPMMGLLPDVDALSQLFSIIGLTPDTQIVAYDDEGGGRAARLLWTLDAIGHRQLSLLNGGLHAWANEGHPLEATPAIPQPSEYHASFNNTGNNPVAQRNEILDGLNDSNRVLLDSRSPEEYRGEKKLAARPGRIPGAVNLDWFNVMDKTNNTRLKPETELRDLLTTRGVTPDKTVIVYCQTHHRSALTYWVLKLLGYPDIKGYPGSWSDWGNREDTPVETG